MRKARFVLLSAVVIASVATAGYAAGNIGADNDGHASSSAPRGVVLQPANAKYAQAAAFVNNEGPTLVRSKGFKAITSPSGGIYCLKLKDTSLAIGKLVPMTTAEWGNSGGNDLLVEVYRAAADCPAHNIEVMTFHGDGAGGWEFYDNLSFFVTVP